MTVLVPALMPAPMPILIPAVMTDLMPVLVPALMPVQMPVLMPDTPAAWSVYKIKKRSKFVSRRGYRF